MRSSTPGDSPEVAFSHSGDCGETDSRDPFDGIKRDSNSLIAAAYNITAIIGVGVLGLPHAMVFLTWYGGPLVLAIAFFITCFTMKQLVRLHDFELGKKKKRYGTYYELGERAFGKNLADWLILPMQMVVEVSLDILFTVAAGEAMNRINISLGRPCVHMFAWFAVFSAIQIVLSFVVPTFESKTLRWIVITAATMSICYSTIAWITIVCVHAGTQPAAAPKPSHGLPGHLPVDYPGPSIPLETKNLVFHAFNAIGVIAFAYAAHNVVLEIQNGIPSTVRKSAKRAMLEAVAITYVVVALCYFPIAFGVYQVHGNTISNNVLSFIFHIQSGKKGHHVASVIKGVSIATNLMLIFHLAGSYQIFALPVFKQLENTFTGHPKLILKIVYIVFTMLLAMIFPYFSPLLGFFGGVAIAPTTYILPCAIWLCIRNQEHTDSPEPKKVVEVLRLLFKGDLRKTKDRYSFYFDWACIILGLLLMIVGIVGGLGVLIEEWENSQNYRLWGPCWRNSASYGSTCHIVPSHCKLNLTP